MQFSRDPCHVLRLRLKVFITPLVLQRLTVATYLTFTSISFPDGRQIWKLRSTCASLTVGKSRFFERPATTVFRTYLDALPFLHVLAMCNGDVKNQSSSWRPAQPPLGARAPKHLTSPPSTFLLNFLPLLPPGPPLFFVSLLMCGLILHILPVWLHREGVARAL